MESIKCPGCNAALTYDVEDKELQCKYCGRICNIEEEKNIDINILESRMIEMNEAFCPDCGAKLMTDINTVSAKCAYCGSSLIYNERIKAFSPKMILLFETNIEKIKSDTLKKMYNLGLNGREELVELLKPIYLPYWIYHCEADVLDNITMKTVTFNNVLVDASKKVKDNIADSVERSFDLSRLKKFDKSMVAGYFAEKYDIDSGSVYDRAVKKMQLDMEHSMPCATFVYITPKPTYILLPFYFAEKNGEQLLVNAQTGKMRCNNVSDIGGMFFSNRYITNKAKISEFQFDEKMNPIKKILYMIADFMFIAIFFIIATVFAILFFIIAIKFN